MRFLLGPQPPPQQTLRALVAGLPPQADAERIRFAFLRVVERSTRVLLYRLARARKHLLRVACSLFQSLFPRSCYSLSPAKRIELCSS